MAPLIFDGAGTISGLQAGGLPDSSVTSADIADAAVTAAKLAAGAGGKILQVVSTTKTDTWSTSSATFADITGLSATITPTSTSSKILAFGQIGAGIKGNTSGIYFALAKGGTIISGATGDAAGSRPRVTAATYPGDTGAVDNFYNVVPFTYLDAPSSTSALTYSIQGRKGPNATTVYVNRSVADRDNADYEPRYISTITLLEVAG